MSELTEIKEEIRKTNLLLKEMMYYGKIVFFLLILLSSLQLCVRY